MKYREAIENTGIATVIGEEDATIFLANAEFEKLSGYAKSEIEKKKSWIEFVAKEDLDRIKDYHCLRRADLNLVPRNYEFKFIDRQGNIKNVSVTDAVIPGTKRSIVSLIDITERKLAEEALRESEEKFRSLFEESRDAIYIATGDGRFVEANQAFLDLFGYTKEELINHNAKEAYANIEVKERLKKALKEKGAVRDFELKIRNKDGDVMDCLVTVTSKRKEDGTTIGYQGIIRDITASKNAEETIRYMAYHDALTGLPNRTLFNDRLNMAIINSKRNKQKLAVMMLDLDKFKDVNDTLGHNVGDMLLKAVAECLTAILRKSDTTARMGGDEFLLLLTNIVQTESTGMVAQKILEAFQKPFVLDSKKLFVTTSIGIAIYPEDGEDIDTLIKNADIAMYSAKKGGRNMYQYYKA